MRVYSVPFLCMAALCSSCASLGDPFFLAFSVDGEYQSEAVAANGIAAYRDRLIATGDVAASEDVQRYFEVALRYDPSNAEARRYLALVEDFRASRFSVAVKDADTLLKKRARSADEEYALLVAVRRAKDIFPADAAVGRLTKSTADIRKAYVQARLDEVRTVRASVKPDSSAAAKERAYIEAFRIVLKVKAVEPGNSSGSKAYGELKTEIASIVKKRLSGLDSLFAKAAFDDAKAQISILKDLDSKIGRTFKEDIAKAEYKLYLSWAKYFEKRKEWSKADARARSALAVQKGSEALALQKRVASASELEERGATFDAGLKNLDSFIASRELIRAQRLLSSLSKSATDAASRQALDLRRKNMAESLAGIYADGVKAYREERFKDAVAALETVASVDASYEDANDYLEKARAKQKLLDQY